MKDRFCERLSVIYHGGWLGRICGNISFRLGIYPIYECTLCGMVSSYWRGIPGFLWRAIVLRFGSCLWCIANLLGGSVG